MKYNKAEIMKAAWEIRKANKCGMGDALRAAWKKAKEANMRKEMSFAWTTQKGAKIEVTFVVEHITRETISADGWPVEVDCDKWRRECTAMSVNGKPQAMHEYDYIHNRVDIAHKGNTRLGAELPAHVVEAICGEERRARDAKLDRELAAAAKYDAHCAMMRKAMGY